MNNINLRDMKKIRWGIISTAKIAREKVIPALKKSAICEVTAIGSPNQERVAQVARQYAIPTVYHSYEEVLTDPEVDAVYIPLPNHLHVPWSLSAIAAGKHVLCEKPIGLSVEEAIQLRDAAAALPDLRVMEAFMYQFHPQWVKAKQLVADGHIGALKVVQSFFSYFNTDPGNIRNRKDVGGGALMDIGCYCISFARHLFREEPKRVFGVVEYDKEMKVDRMTSSYLEFSSGISQFTCSTQLMPYQRVNILGTKGRIEVEVPVNAPPDQISKIMLYSRTGKEEYFFDPVDQYTLQCDAFAKSILYNIPLPVTLDDAIQNMRVVEAIFESEGRMVSL